MYCIQNTSIIYTRQGQDALHNVFIAKKKHFINILPYTITKNSPPEDQRYVDVKCDVLYFECNVFLCNVLLLWLVPNSYIISQPCIVM